MTSALDSPRGIKASPQLVSVHKCLITSNRYLRSFSQPIYPLSPSLSFRPFYSVPSGDWHGLEDDEAEAVQHRESSGRRLSSIPFTYTNPTTSTPPTCSCTHEIAAAAEGQAEQGEGNNIFEEVMGGNFEDQTPLPCEYDPAASYPNM